MRKTTARRIRNRSNRYAARMILRTMHDDVYIPRERRIGRIRHDD